MRARVVKRKDGFWYAEYSIYVYWNAVDSSYPEILDWTNDDMKIRHCRFHTAQKATRALKERLTYLLGWTEKPGRVKEEGLYFRGSMKQIVEELSK